MPVRDDRKVELGEVDALGLDIMSEDVGVVAGVKKNLLAAILDIGGEPPILLHGGGLAEGVVEDRDPGRCIRPC